MKHSSRSQFTVVMLTIATLVSCIHPVQGRSRDGGSVPAARSRPSWDDTTKTVQFPDMGIGKILLLDRNWDPSTKKATGSALGWAKGKVDVPTNRALLLLANYNLLDNPELLDSLAPDVFECISFAQLPAEDKLVSHLVRLTGLRRIELDNSDITDACFEDLSKMTNLEGLGIGGCMFKGTSLGSLASLQKLRFINLDRNDISKVDLSCLGKLTELTSLRMSRCGLQNSSLAFLPKLTKLKEIRLEGNARITDALIPTLDKMKSLKALALSGTSITPDGLVKCKLNPRFVSMLSMTPEERMRVQARFPGISLQTIQAKRVDESKTIFAPLH